MGVNWKAAVGVILSGVLLYFAFRGVDAGEVVAEIRRADPLLFVLAGAVATATMLFRAWRWRPLLQPVRADIAFRPRFAATTIGFMANNLLPARVGEFARAYALARLEHLPTSAAFASLVVERLLDGLTVVAFLFVAMAMPSFPAVQTVGGQNLDAVALGMLALFGAVGVVLLAMTLWPTRSVAFFERTVARVLPRGIRRPVVDALEAFLLGLDVLRRPALLAQAVGWSLAHWLVNAFSFWLGFLAFGIDVPFSGALFLQSLIALAVALPSAPGFFGVYEAGVRVGLVEIWRLVPLNKALGFAIGFHLAGFIPVTLLGLYYAWRLGLSWREVERSEEFVEEAVEAVSPALSAERRTRQ